MSTQNWSDDDLDDFFRRSAEESDPERDSSGWQDLQARLNHRDRTLLAVKLMRWGLPVFLVVMILGSVIWYTSLFTMDPKRQATITGHVITPVHPHPSAPVSRQVNRRSVASLPERTEVDSASQPVSTSLITAATSRGNPDLKLAVQPSPSVINLVPLDIPGHLSPKSTLPAPSAPGLAVADSKGKNPRSQNQPEFGVRKSARVVAPKSLEKRITGAGHLVDPLIGLSQTNGFNHPRNTGLHLVKHRDKADPTPIDNQSNGADYAHLPLLTATHLADFDMSTDRLVMPTPVALAIRSATWPSAQLSAPKELVWPDTTSVRQPLAHSIASSLSGLSVQAVLSPDLSGVGLRNFDRLGSNIGVLAQYQFTPRFSLQAGALWSTKVYTASAVGYVWPIQAQMIILPESVSAKCVMIDVPLNLRYDVFLRSSGSKWGPARWFVSGGATSYYINREVYDYRFVNPNDPAIRSRHYDNKALGREGGQFGFSNINVSVGYERPISRHLSWQVEPFMKIPIQPIGYFDVRLLSTGIFLSLRYRL